jgi:DNA-binding SARP family transcriptional activator
VSRLSGIRVRLLGEFAIEREGRPTALTGLNPLAQSVLAVLALRAGRAVGADELADGLWPSGDEERSRANLRVLVSRVRAALGDPALVRGGRPGYRLDPAVEVDIDIFERAADEGRAALADGQPDRAARRFDEALALYRGDLVVIDGDDRWAVGRRERVRERRRSALEDLGESLVRLGRPREAIAPLEQIIADDPLREGAYRGLMRAHYAAGEQSEALRAYERCRRALDDELGVDPLPETMSLHERILRREPVSFTAAAATTREELPFVGRANERAAADEAITRARSGATLIAIVAEAGGGKSRFVGELLALRTDVATLECRCYEVERDVPFRPLVAALTDRIRSSGDTDGLLRALGPLGPWAAEVIDALREARPDLAHPPETPAPQSRARIVEALARAIVSLARGRVLVLTLDDAQWADGSTLDVAHHLLRRIPEASVAVLATARTEDLVDDHPLARLIVDMQREGRALRVALPPFTREEIEQLLQATGKTREHASDIERRSAGNPFFVSELVRSPSATPATVRDAIVGRLAVLPPGARELLEAAAVLGSRCTLDMAAAVAGRTIADAAGQIDTLAARHLLRATEGGMDLAFAHDIVRESIYAALPPGRRLALHRSAASALESRAPAEVAYHAERGADAPRAFRFGLRAGEQALRAHALREALAHLDRTARAAEDPAIDAGDRRRCIALRAEVKHELGRSDEARADLHGALASARADGAIAEEIDLLTRLGRLEGGHDYNTAITLGREALAVATRGADDALLVRCLVALARTLTNRLALDEASELLSRASRVADRVDDAARLLVLDSRWLVDLFRADIAGTRDANERALALLGSSPASRRLPYELNLATCAYYSGHVDDALAQNRACNASWRGVDAAVALAFGLVHSSFVLLEHGELAEAGAVAAEAAELARSIDHVEWYTASRIVAARAAAYAGDHGRALAEIAAADATLPRLGSGWWEAHATLARAIALAASGPEDEARRTLETLRERAAPLVAVEASLVLTDLATTAPARAREAERTLALPQRDARLFALAAQAHLAAATGDAAGAASALATLRAGGAHLRADRAAIPL